MMTRLAADEFRQRLTVVVAGVMIFAVVITLLVVSLFG